MRDSTTTNVLMARHNDNKDKLCWWHSQRQQAARLVKQAVAELVELSNEQIDTLIATARILLRHEPEFQKFLSNSEGRLAADAISEQELCNLFVHELCK